MRGFRKSLSLASCAMACCVASPALATETTTYTYDALGRIKQVSHSGTANNGLQATYTHDAADNRQNVAVTGSPFNSAVRVIVVPLGGLTVIPIGGSAN